MSDRGTDEAAGIHTWLASVLAAALFGLLAGPAPAQQCAGDCDGDGTPSVAERQSALAIAFGENPLASCNASDSDLDGAVRMPDLTRATVASLDGCAAAAAGGPRGGFGQVVVHIGDTSGLPGETPSFDVTFNDGGDPVAGIQIDIGFQPETPVLANASQRPTCAVNPGIDKNGSAFSFQPPNCAFGGTCTAIRALILALDNVDPIPDGSLLFSCTVQISPAAPNGTYPLVGTGLGASDPNGNALSTTGTDGAVFVGPGGPGGGSGGSLILKRARLRADTSDRPGVDKGTLLVDGVVNTNDPFGGLIDDIQASGLSASVQTAAGVDVALDWEAADCEFRPSARGPRITCTRETAGVRRSVSFRPISTPNLFVMKLQARGLAFQPPLSADPVQVTITTGSLARGDDIDGCEVRGSRSQVESCREVGVQPTQTATPSVTRTSTRTATATRTATLTASITATPTITRTPTVTDTPTPLVVPSVALGTREFTIAEGSYFSSPDFSGSGFFTTRISGLNAAFDISAAPLLIDGGVPDVDGVAPLSLQQDAVIGLSLFDGTTLCLKLLAAGSGGSIDCDGGTAYDVEASQPTGDVGGAFTLQTGLGAAAGPGDGVLVVQQQVEIVPEFFADCGTVTYSQPAQTWAYTTTSATATKGAVQLAVDGEPFDCNAFATPGTGGRLAAPYPSFHQFDGDVASVLRIEEVTAPIGTHLCTLDSSPGASHIELNTALGAPLDLPLGGALQFQFGQPGADGNAFSTCQVLALDPVNIPSIGVVCLNSTFGCGSSTIDCDGGTPLGIDLRSNGNAGACNNHFDCFNTCDTYCFGQGLFTASAGCTGFCNFNGSQACNVDADCGFNGPCYGPDPIGASANICQCTCQRFDSGSGSRPGEAQCQLGVNILIEASAPCDFFDPVISVGDACFAVTTAPLTDLFLNTNFGGGQLPLDGEAVNEGLPKTCDAIRDTGVGGLQGRGAVNFFATALGDMAVELFATCQ